MDNGQSSNEEHRYNIGVIRKLLTDAFSAEELRRLCWEQSLFRPVYEKFTDTIPKDSMIDYLLEFCERQILFGELLSEVQRRAPRQYEQYKDQLYEVISTESDRPDLKTQSSDPISISGLGWDWTSVIIIQVLLSDERYPLAEDRQKILVELVATVCKAPIDNVWILRMSPGGSVWVSLAIPKPDAEKFIRLFKTNDQDLWPLLAEFRIGDISLLPVQLPPTGLEHFGPDHISLVRLLYLGAKRVLVEREFGGGYGGAQVLLAQPINRQDRPMARQIIKIGVRAELCNERDNYVQHIERDLPLVAARLDNYAEWGGLAGLTYVFMGDGMLGQTQTLEVYYQDTHVSTEKIIQTLKDLLAKELGQRWYGHSTPHICFFAEEYGMHLVEHLRLKLRPASADGIWPVEQVPALIADYKRLPGEVIGQEHQNISSGTLVQIDDLLVSKVKSNELKLQPPTNPGTVVKIECQPDSDIVLAFSPGDQVVIRGEVIYNRQDRLEKIVSAVFSDFSEAMVDVKQDRLNWGSDRGQFPNPLHFYPNILSRTLRGRKSMVHGDLHLRNVLVDQQGRSWLIDFAQVSERHNLYDFIKLETYIRQMVLSQQKYQFSFEAYLQFEEALVAASLGGVATVPEDPDLQKAYQVIQSLREIATHYMGHPADFHGEYFPALFLYNLAVLKYYDNHSNKAARLAFATATILGKVLIEPELVAPSLIPEQVDTKIYTEVQYSSEDASTLSAVEVSSGLQWEKIFDTAVIRDLLTIALNASDLNDLCQDYFPEVHRDFSEGMTTSKRKRLLIDYCTRHNQFQLLVRQIRKINPEQYRAYFPHLVKPVTDKFKSEKDPDHIRAARTLGRLGEPGAIPLLEAQLLKQPNPTVGYWLAVAIGEIGDPEAKETLKRLHAQLTEQGADPYTLLGIEDALQLVETKS